MELSEVDGPAHKVGRHPLQATKDKSKMDDPRSGSVPDKSGAAMGPGSGTADTSQASKDKAKADDPRSGGKTK